MLLWSLSFFHHRLYIALCTLALSVLRLYRYIWLTILMHLHRSPLSFSFYSTPCISRLSPIKSIFLDRYFMSHFARATVASHRLFCAFFVVRVMLSSWVLCCDLFYVFLRAAFVSRYLVTLYLLIYRRFGGWGRRFLCVSAQYPAFVFSISHHAHQVSVFCFSFYRSLYFISFLFIYCCCFLLSLLYSNYIPYYTLPHF